MTAQWTHIDFCVYTAKGNFIQVFSFSFCAAAAAAVAATDAVAVDEKRKFSQKNSVSQKVFIDAEKTLKAFPTSILERSRT